MRTLDDPSSKRVAPNVLTADVLLNYLEFISAGEGVHCSYRPERLKYA